MSKRKSARRVALLVAVAALCAAARSGAQGGGGPRSLTVREIVPVEMVLGYVAFEMNVPDEQLVQVRRTLRGVHAKRERVVMEMLTRKVEAREVRARVFSLRRQMLQGLSVALDDEQEVELFRAMGEQEEEGEPLE